MVCAHHLHHHGGNGDLGGDALFDGVVVNPRRLQDQHDCWLMALDGLDVEVGHDDDVDDPHGGVEGPS